MLTFSPNTQLQPRIGQHQDAGFADAHVNQALSAQWLDDVDLTARQWVNLNL